MAVVRFKKKAKRAIAKTLRDSYEKFGSASANKMNLRIELCTELIALQPRMGKIEPELSNKKYEYRSFVVYEHFKMVYRLDEMKDVVYIIHFWDVRRESQRLAEEIEKL